MICFEHETLRRRWVAARANYQMALADLQTSSGVDEFRDALKRANEAFADSCQAEVALNAHLEGHGCSRIPVFRPVSQSTRSGAV